MYTSDHSVYFNELIATGSALSSYVFDALPGFGTQCFDFVLLNELTASELLYLSVQVTDVPHCHTHREGCLYTTATHSSSKKQTVSYPGTGQKKKPKKSNVYRNVYTRRFKPWSLLLGRRMCGVRSCKDKTQVIERRL